MSSARITLSGICVEADQIDLLRHAVVEDLEVLRPRPSDRLAAVGHEHVDADGLDLRREGRACAPLRHLEQHEGSHLTGSQRSLETLRPERLADGARADRRRHAPATRSTSTTDRRARSARVREREQPIHRAQRAGAIAVPPRQLAEREERRLRVRIQRGGLLVRRAAPRRGYRALLPPRRETARAKYRAGGPAARRPPAAIRRPPPHAGRAAPARGRDACAPSA